MATEQIVKKKTELPFLLVIVGETASGKSGLAMEVAKKYKGEIISADSRAVYKHLDVGSAKPSQQDQAMIKHHLIDVVEPNQRFTAARFQRLANKAIKDINNRGKLPIMVGGTGLYIDSVIFDYKFSPLPQKELRTALLKLPDEKLREKVVSMGGIEVDLHNKRHMIRFIETGGTAKQKLILRKNTLVIGIRRNKSELRQRIEQRVEQMFRAGLRKEIDDLVNKYGWDNEAMTGIVYKLFKEYEDGKISMMEVKRKFVLKDLQLAKRQRTWFKRNPHIIWCKDETEAVRVIDGKLVDINTTN